jgi:hypothetical protein
VAEKRLTGYRRPDGRVGIRNHVLIVPVDDLSNAVAESVAGAIPGTLALPHPYGRLQFGADLDLFFQTIIGTGANPNVAAVVVIGIEPSWTERIASGIAETGKPVAQFSIERHGDLRVLEMAGRRAAQLLQDASELSRVPVERGELLMSIKCGESDTTSGLGANPATSEAVDRHIAAGGTVIFGETTELTGGEHLIAERCASDEVRKKFQGFFDDYFALVERTGANLLGSQHPGRPVHHRGEGAGQHPEDRDRAGRGRAGPGRTAQPGRAQLHGHVLRGGRVHHADRGSRGGHPPVSHRPGQRGRPPGRAGYQDHREPVDPGHHERAHRRGRFRPAPAGL